jgi:hypothetical protein
MFSWNGCYLDGIILPQHDIIDRWLFGTDHVQVWCVLGTYVMCVMYVYVRCASMCDICTYDESEWRCYDDMWLIDVVLHHTLKMREEEGSREAAYYLWNKFHHGSTFNDSSNVYVCSRQACIHVCCNFTPKKSRTIRYVWCEKDLYF